MNSELIEIINKAKIAQKANCILTPDMIDGDIILSAHIIYDENMDGYVATRNTYKFRGDLAKAGFTWVQTKKVWVKPITIN